MSKKMLEPRHVRNERLKKEGRWTAFLARRKGLAECGRYTPSQAAIILEAEFGPSTEGVPPPRPLPKVEDPADPPPLPVSRKRPEQEDVEPVDEQPEPEPSAPDTAELPGPPAEALSIEAAPAAIKEDVLWAYNNFDNPNATVKTAPRPSAYYLLQWAKNSKAKFFGDMVPGLVKTVEKEADKRRGDDGRELFALLDRFEQQTQAAESAAAS